MIVYVCHPYGGDTVGNVAKVRVIARELIDAGHCPIAPQLFLGQLMNDHVERGLAMQVCMRLLDVCDVLYQYGKPTQGMREELAHAQAIGKPVNLKAWKEQP